MQETTIYRKTIPKDPMTATAHWWISFILKVMPKSELEAIKDRHPSAGVVRSIGLFSTIELVKDGETKELLPPQPGLPSSPEDAQVAPRLSAALRKRGIHCFVKRNLLFPMPPLCINEAQLGDGLRILDEVLNIAGTLTGSR